MVAYQEALMNEYAKREMAKSGVAWFKFDEASGDVNDSKGTAVGTVTGTTRVQGIGGNAISFNGTGDFIDFNNPIIPLGKKSIRFKMKKANMQSKVENIIGNSNATSEHGTNVFFGADNFLYFQSTKAVSGTPRFLIGFNYSSYADNQWHDILLTWDGSVNTNGVKMYIDDMTSPKTQGTANLIESTQAGRNLRVARGFNTTVGAEDFFNGQLDNLEIYNDVIDLTPINKTLILSNGEYKKYTSSVIGSGYSTLKNLIPTLIKASKYFDTRVPLNAFDGNINTVWNFNVASTTGFAEWIQFGFNNAVKATKINILGVTTANSIKDFKIQGSNDESTWIDLKGNTTVTYWTSSPMAFTLDVVGDFKFYRIIAFSTNGGTYPAIAEITIEGHEIIEKLGYNWQTVSPTLPTSTQFLEQGMDDLSILDRKVTELPPMQMEDKTSILFTNGEAGKVYQKTIDLQKYMDIRSMKVEVK